MMNRRRRVDWWLMVLPFLAVVGLFGWFLKHPAQSAQGLATVRSFLGSELGLFYMVLGLGFFGVTMYVAFSRYGQITLGHGKPKYSGWQWGMMVFTSTMAADILFYSLCEWTMYAKEPHIKALGGMQQWASTYPLFHWGPIAWGFYIVLAIAFAFMMHVRRVPHQKFSAACRPVLGQAADGLLGKMIDLVAIFALIAGTATTFSLATPLLAAAVSRVFGIANNQGLAVILLLVIAAVYTAGVVFGLKGIAKLASMSVGLFLTLLAYFLFAGGQTGYILETGFSAVGNLAQNFIGLATWMDPMRKTGFVQNWTVYYWAYWMSWSVATPFFIAKISRGRSLKQMILGGYGWGLAGTFLSFIVLGNYGLAQQVRQNVDILGVIDKTKDYSAAIIAIFDTMPWPTVGLIVLAITMVAFYATTFDSLTLVVSAYSYKELAEEAEPAVWVRVFWALLFILLPIALIFANNSLYSLQSVAIIAAFPIGIVMLVIVWSFFKDAKAYLGDQSGVKRI